MQTEHTYTLNLIWDSLQEEDLKKEQSHCAWFSGSPLQQIRAGVMKGTERYDLAKIKWTESLAEYLFTHIVKYRVIILKEVAHVARKKKSLFSITHSVSKVRT